MKQSLLTHPLVTAVSDGYYAAFQSATKRTGREVEWTRELNSDQKYAQRLFSSVPAVIYNLNQIRQAGLFLSGFRTTKRLKEHEITRLDHIVYHVENFFLRTTGCLDRCLVLVNDALDLGLQPEDCTHRLIRTISHVKRSPIQGVLGEINAIVKPYRNQRNLIAHRARHTDDELDDVILFDLVVRIEPTDEARYHHYKLRSDRYVAAKQEEIDQVADKLTTACSHLFDKLKPDVDGHLSALKL